MNKIEKSILVIILTVSIILFFLHAPLVNADTSGQLLWGEIYVLDNPKIVSSTSEIPVGQCCYVVNKQTNTGVSIPHVQWEALMHGDMSSIVASIQRQIPGSVVKEVRISWLQADYHKFIYYGNDQSFYVVSGFQVEALVYNQAAGLSGLEITVIILAIAFLIAVLTFCSLGAWIIMQVLNAAGQLGPIWTIGVGLISFIIVAAVVLIALTIILGGGKKRR